MSSNNNQFTAQQATGIVAITNIGAGGGGSGAVQGTIIGSGNGSSGPLTLPSTAGTTWTTSTIGGHISSIQTTYKKTCNVCEEESEHYYITFNQYNPTNAGFSYSGSKFDRFICGSCYCKAMDKLFGVKLDAEVEDLLFKE